MAVTIVTGDLSTGTINQARRVPDMDEKIAELEPDAAPLVTLLRKLRNVPAIAPQVQWLENEPMPRFDVLSASAASNATALPVTNGNYFRVGDIIRNTNTGAGYEVSATAAGAITVGAALGSTASTAHTSGDEIFIVGNSNAEGASLRQIKTAQIANKSNYTQIVRTPYGLTGTEAATKLYGGPDRMRLKAEAALEHERTWEQIALVGPKSETGGSTAAPERTAGGMKEFVTTNLVAGGGGLVETKLQELLRVGFRYSSGAGRKLLLASPIFISAMEGFARANIQVVNDRGATYGINMRTYVSGQGEIDIAMERWLADSLVYRGYAFLVDIDAVAYCPLRPTKYLEERQANDADKIEDEWLTEATFMWKHERRHAIITGVTN